MSMEVFKKSLGERPTRSDVDCSIIDGKPMIAVGVGYEDWWLVDGSNMQILNAQTAGLKPLPSVISPEQTHR